MTEAAVEVVPYRSEWPEQFERERHVLARALAPWLVGEPEHIGSTAVPGLSAKPVIDIMAPVRSLLASVPAIAAAEGIGYVHFPYKPELMHWFCKPSRTHRTHHLHLVPFDGGLWRERLAFRDALRASASLRAEYEALKLKLAAEYQHDREAYTEAKSPFITRVTEEALASTRRAT
jgi:GrpB-like predicted nucleotidyltransferase (UPF0157 family)